VDGKLMFPEGMREVSVRYRGDFLVHWGFEKKSFRIRTKNKELFDGLQTFNLVVPKFPEQVNNYLGYRLAGELGLMAPRCELVNVMLNGRNLGLYEYTEQLDEGTLRRHGQATGEIFAGDLIAKDSYQGVTNNVFELPELWDQLVDSKHRIPGSREPLYRLVRLLNTPPTEASVAELGELLDMQAFGAFGAFEVLTQTHHFDETHNWRLAWNPWTQKFHASSDVAPPLRRLLGGPPARHHYVLPVWPRGTLLGGCARHAQSSGSGTSLRP
jgi:spore coat protein CotH